MRRRARESRRRHGAAMIEAAIVLSVFLSLVLGMLDLSIGVFRNHVISHAARQAVRLAIVHGKMAPPKMTAWGPTKYSAKGSGTDEIATAIQPYFTGLDPSQVNIVVEWIDGSNDVEQRVRVTISTTWTPIMLALSGSQKTISAASTMPIAH